MRHNWVDAFSQRRYHLEETMNGFELRFANDPDGTYGPPVESMAPYAATIARELLRVSADLETETLKAIGLGFRAGMNSI